jgi:WD40 repeat protein
LDSETKSELRILPKGNKNQGGMVGYISSISWCKGGSKILISGPYDDRVFLWDISEPRIEKTFLFKSVIVLSQSNPRNRF